MLLFLVACGGAQSGGGKAFCDSYEMNFLGECRRSCEENVEPGDKVGIEQCEDTCYAELVDDDTFSSDCGDRARDLRNRS